MSYHLRGGGTGYAYPERAGPAEELKSLQLHAKIFSEVADVPPPDPAVNERVLYHLEKALSSCVWELKTDFDSYQGFLRSLRRLEMSSSPGYPYCLEATTNGEWLGWNGVWFDEQRLALLWNDVLAVFRNESPCIMRTFIKMEPHKESKLEEGRLRLIQGLPLADQVAWQMLYADYCDKLVENAYEIPLKHGMKMYGGSWKLYHKQFKANGFDVGLDRKAHDWTCMKWKLDNSLVICFRLGRGKRMLEWYELAKILHQRVYQNPLLMLSDGSIWRQLVAGIQKSGTVKTIVTNGVIVVIDHCFVMIIMGFVPDPSKSAVLGDDSLLEKKFSDVAIYRDLGVIIKSASEGLEFAGHEFTDSGPVPLYFSKHLEKMLTVSNDVLSEYFDSIMRLYTHHPVLQPFWRLMARECGVEDQLLSDQAYQFWYDFEE